VLDIILLFIGLVLAVAVAFLIPTLLELRRAAAQTTTFLKSTGESLDTSLKEIDDTMKSLREITENINTVTQDARNFSSSLVHLADDVKSVGESVHNLTSRTSRSVSSIRAGIMAACEVLIRNLITRRGGNT
jgi:uncharacterized protein YoxC